MGLGCPEMRLYAMLDHVKAIFGHFWSKTKKLGNFRFDPMLVISDFATEPLYLCPDAAKAAKTGQKRPKLA